MSPRWRALASLLQPQSSPDAGEAELVFQLRQLRERVLRIRTLLDCLVSHSPAQSTQRLLAILVLVGQDRRSVRAHNVSGVDRLRIGSAIRARARTKLCSFFWPVNSALMDTAPPPAKPHG